MKALIYKYLPTILSIAVGIVPIVMLIVCFDVPRKLILGWGILSYILGVTMIKMPLYHLVVVRVLHSRLSHVWLGCSQGIISAISELGSAFLFFVFVVPDLTFTQLLGFGVAAGSVEAVVLPFIGNPFQGTPLETHANNVLSRAAGRHAHEWLSVLERIMASCTHTATRGLVYIGLITSSILPVFIAVVTFAALDGRGYYAHLEKWAFDDVRVLVKFYLYFFAIVVVQTASFLMFYLSM
jgi:hypothetical protein